MFGGHYCPTNSLLGFNPPGFSPAHPASSFPHLLTPPVTARDQRSRQGDHRNSVLRTLLCWATWTSEMRKKRTEERELRAGNSLQVHAGTRAVTSIIGVPVAPWDYLCKDNSLQTQPSQDKSGSDHANTAPGSDSHSRGVLNKQRNPSRQALCSPPHHCWLLHLNFESLLFSLVSTAETLHCVTLLCKCSIPLQQWICCTWHHNLHLCSQNDGVSSLTAIWAKQQL